MHHWLIRRTIIAVRNLAISVADGQLDTDERSSPNMSASVSISLGYLVPRLSQLGLVITFARLYTSAKFLGYFSVFDFGCQY